MELTLLFFFIIVCLTAVIFILWRRASSRRSLPCPAWLSWLVELDNPFARTNRAATIIEHLALQPGMSVLDFGCGPGRVSIPLARAVGGQGKVVAVDIQPAMLEKAQNKARDAALDNIEFLHAGAGEGKIGQHRFDRAVMVTVLGEIPEKETALQEVYTALKPGGILSITEIIFDPHFQKRATVSQIADKVGFQEKAFWGNRLAYTLNLKKPEPEI